MFTWSIAGPDSAPRRPGMPTRVVALVLAVAAHSVLAKVLYARAPEGPDGEAVREAAQLMYYGGDLAELALAAALFAIWYRRRAHAPWTTRLREPVSSRTGSACGGTTA
ncbi:cytochrome c oxidase assembly protein [Actinophytocola algeriensis]|uniref:Cytochrome c oxidase assembly factor CtaG n=1 Tax=Actinophytocola algeriensis TaxID=1768010 RepID=A0A7W7VIW9_9PSEU|nr:cytochrome c oxidase assembly protein [Actinophytocola algeriensis]MBB4911490.1 cytochrome c oxidase assembly factor CtaG [Actinophytocola algeriensis]MBE1473522.1 cytochrome c oxidase assembly factor CtaG [Actinophytocola algeriensis]